MIDMTDMLKVFQNHRGDAIVISGRASKNWVNISTYEKRDVPLGDPAMGGHASFAFGLALANPDKKIVLFDSEGDVLMNMGVLTLLGFIGFILFMVLFSIFSISIRTKKILIQKDKYD